MTTSIQGGGQWTLKLDIKTLNTSIYLVTRKYFKLQTLENHENLPNLGEQIWHTVGIDAYDSKVT